MLTEYKKIFINDEEGEKKIHIEFSESYFISSVIQTQLTNYIKKTPSVYVLNLTELNVVNVVEKLASLKFSIDSNILELYNEIKTWDKNHSISQFLYPQNNSQVIRGLLTNDIGEDSIHDTLLISDRRLRYQYYTSYELPKTSLPEIIASRTTPSVWINSLDHSFYDLLLSLKKLKRFPILISFDDSSSSKIVKDLQELSDALDKIGINDNVGIYCRMKNMNNSKHQFNTIIAENQYNSVLCNDTMVAGVMNRKLPKFLLNVDWCPKTIISLHNAVHGKLSIYSNKCDLVVTYTELKPIIHFNRDF